MRIEVNMNEADIAESLSAVAKREARKIIKEEAKSLIAYELKHDKELQRIVNNAVCEHLDKAVAWYSMIDDRAFGDMTERDKIYFERGAKMAHSFDLEDKLDDERILRGLVSEAAENICTWVRQNEYMKNKLAVAIREVAEGSEE